MTTPREEDYGRQEAEIDELYRDVILDHFRSPRHRGSLPSPTVSREGYNPLCGDEVVVDLLVKDGVLDEVAFHGAGCSISQSSASMMTELLKGKTLEEAEALTTVFRNMMLGKDIGEAALEELGDLVALEGVKKFPVRIKCALLPWTTLQESIAEYRGKR
jgi:nitrogen fixation NifU-like protein